MCKIEAVHEGVTHKGLWRFWDSQIKTACGKTLKEGTYKETNCFIRGAADCADCLSKR